MEDPRPTALTVNGNDVWLKTPADVAMIFALRNELGLRGVRSGCAIGECGACTVLVDGRPVRSCITPLESVEGSRVTTPEGLGTPDQPDTVQQAFLGEQAAQCGYCINGIIMTASSLVHEQDASEERIQEALAEHLCRCGTHARVLRAIRSVLGLPAPDEASPVRSAQPGDVEVEPSAWPPPLEKAPEVQDWIRLLPDGRIEVLSGRSEIGQGIHTALGQIVAAHVGLPVDQVIVRSPTTQRSPDEDYTAGSRSIMEGGVALAMAAVAFRRLLLQRAAEKLGEPPDDLVIERQGRIRSREAGTTLALSELASDHPLTGRITAADRPNWEGEPLGEPVARPDLLPKLTGSPAYVHDLALPGMLHARALLPPSYEAALDGLDTDRVREMPGVRSVLRDGRLVVVIAGREEQAIGAVSALEANAEWHDPGVGITGDTATMLRSLPAEPYVGRQDAGVEDRLSTGNRLRATYSKPYEVHGAMAPSCAVALHEEGNLTVWTHSQGVHPLRRELAALLGEEEARVTVMHQDGPGCYGQNCADDAAAFAAVAARQVPGHPVRFLFSVYDEFGWEPYGPAMVADLEAALDDVGSVVAWRHRARTDSHSARPRGQGDRLAVSWLREDGAERPWSGAGEGGGRNVVPLYDLPAVEAVAEHVRGPLRTGSLRSLGSYFNVFAIESFIDELAEAAGADPLEFRLAHLRDERARAVLEAAAEAAGWAPRVGPSGRGQGLAVARYKDRAAYVAQVVDCQVDPDTGEISVDRIVMVCDAGVIVNADGLRNQLEGGTLQGLSRALHESLRVDTGGVRSRDWSSYPVLRFAAVPKLEVILLDRPGSSPLGAGEASTPVVAPAVANAIDDAIGIRLRDLPLTTEAAERRLLDMSAEEMARVLIA